MGVRTLFLTEALYRYLTDVTVREPDVLRELRIASSAFNDHYRQSAPDQAQLMAMLVELVGARRALEVGTFRGYSALAVALALPPDGVLITCDIDATSVAWARPYWEKAGVASRITTMIGSALDTLDALLADGEDGSFDFAFLDADKTNQDVYYERALRLVRQGGLIVLDNVFWGGKVMYESIDEPIPSAVHALNLKLRNDSRVTTSTLPVGDGVTLVRKR